MSRLWLSGALRFVLVYIVFVRKKEKNATKTTTTQKCFTSGNEKLDLFKEQIVSRLGKV